MVALWLNEVETSGCSGIQQRHATSVSDASGMRWYYLRIPLGVDTADDKAGSFSTMCFPNDSTVGALSIRIRDM